MGLIIMDASPIVSASLLPPIPDLKSDGLFSFVVGFSLVATILSFVEMSEEVFSLLPPFVFLLIYIAGMQLGPSERVVGFWVLILGLRWILVYLLYRFFHHS